MDFAKRDRFTPKIDWLKSFTSFNFMVPSMVACLAMCMPPAEKMALREINYIIMIVLMLAVILYSTNNWKIHYKK